jgi:endonuclease V-like protein UPF0215 family
LYQVLPEKLDTNELGSDQEFSLVDTVSDLCDTVNWNEVTSRKQRMQTNNTKVLIVLILFCVEKIIFNAVVVEQHNILMNSCVMRVSEKRQKLKHFVLVLLLVKRYN